MICPFSKFVSISALTLAIGLLALRASAGDAPPDLSIALGERNAGQGLRVPSSGDGANAPEMIGGVAARRISGDRGHYLYVIIDHPAYAKGPRDVYVTVEAFDDTVGVVTLQYDKAADTPDISTKYTHAEQSMILVGAGRWRKACFFLPALGLGHGQNNGADFRLAARGVAVRSITVTSRRPEGFEADSPVDAESLKAVRVAREGGMELTFGNDATPAQAALYSALSVTSVESYVDWAGVEPREGKWDWSKWDKQVATLRAARLKWVPFLIAGPAYATPLWFQRGPNSHYYRCLEHGQDSRVQSIFNPKFRPYVERFINEFAKRYGDSGVIESVLLGVTGIYGESIYPAGPQGGWTTRLNGEYHNHHGWWAGDALAREAFRAAMRARYADIAALNKAWGTQFASFDSVTAFLPDKAPSDRAKADFVEWYQQSMTEWATFWVSATRKAMPKAEIYLCTGGNGIPSLGADFTAQAAAIAPLGAGIRITNESSDYAHNFSVTREVATATRHYGTFCGFEPAGTVTPAGVVARIYNASASGARQLHFYSPNVLEGPAAIKSFRDNAALIIPRKPRLDVAMYLSRETWALAPDAANRAYSLSRSLRDLVDHDYITRRTVADGILRNYRALILTDSAVLEPPSAKAIEQWVRDGGILISVARKNEPIGLHLYDNAEWRGRMFTADGQPPRVKKIDKGWTVEVDAPAKGTADLSTLLRETPTILPGAKPLAPDDGRADHRFHTHTESGNIWFAADDAKISDK